MGGYGDEPTKAWIEGLKGIEPSRIKFGVDKCVKNGLSWPPSLPEFVELTKPNAEDIGAPSFEEAYQEACDGGRDVLQECQGGYKQSIGKDWRHPAIYHAYKSIDGFRFIDNEKSKRERFAKKYSEMIERIARGEKLEAPEVVLRLNNNPSGVKTSGNQSAAKSTLADLKSMFGGK